MKFLRFFPLICCGFVASGCGSNPSSTGAAGSNATNAATSSGAGNSSGVVTIISPHNPEIQTEFAALWKTQNPGSEIKWIDQGGTSDDLNFVRQQFASGSKEKGIGVDLFFGGGGETFTEMEKDGLLVPLPSDYGIPAQLNGVPLRGKNNDWVAAALSGFGILYNKNIATRDKLPVPQSWEGLTNPQLRDRIELADPRHSGSAHTAYEIILQSNGWDKGWKILTAMTGNARTFATNSSAPLLDVRNGEAVFCLAIDFYATNAIKEAGADKLAYVQPIGQNLISADPIALLAGAPNASAAKKFVQMVMSPEGQKLWLLQKGSEGGPKNSTLYRLAALPKVYGNKNAFTTLNPYGQKVTVAYNADKASLRRRALDDLFGAVLVDNHDAVKAAWQKNPDMNATGFVPISEAELTALAPKWDDPKISGAAKAKWGDAARAKFAG